MIKHQTQRTQTQELNVATARTEWAQALGRINNFYAAVVLFLSRADGGPQLRVKAAALIMTPAEGVAAEEEEEE